MTGPHSSRGPHALPGALPDASPAPGGHLDVAVAARASVVNRTHRIVRERARSQSDRRSRAKSLWIPLAVCSALLIVLAVAGWMILAQTELAPTGIPDASAQMLVFFLWFLPVSAALLAAVWFRKSQNSTGSESI